MLARRLALLGLLTLLVPIPVEARGRKSGGGGSKRKRRSRQSGRSSGSGPVYFSSCREARAAGYSRMRPGDPGYSANLDRDGDGIACE